MNPSPDSLPPPPPIWSFLEHSAGRILVETVLGGLLGGLLLPWLPGFGAGGGFEVSTAGAVSGAVLAPMALLLTPKAGPRLRQALRYALALAVSGMLLASFLGPGRERPLTELLSLGGALFVMGAMLHGFRSHDALDSDDEVG